MGYKLADRPRDLTRAQINFLIASLNARTEAAEVAQLAEEGVTRIMFREPDEEEDQEDEGDGTGRDNSNNETSPK